MQIYFVYERQIPIDSLKAIHLNLSVSEGFLFCFLNLR